MRRKLQESKIFNGRRRMLEAVVVGGTMHSHVINPGRTHGNGQGQEADHHHHELEQQRQWLEILHLFSAGEVDVDGWTTCTACIFQVSPGLR